MNSIDVSRILTSFLTACRSPSTVLSAKTQPAFRADRGQLRDEDGAAGRAYRPAGIFIEYRIGGAEIMASQSGGAEIILFKNRKGMFGIRCPDLQLKVRAASALGAVPCFTGNQRRYPLPGQYQLQGF